MQGAEIDSFPRAITFVHILIESTDTLSALIHLIIPLLEQIARTLYTQDLEALHIWFTLPCVNVYFCY